MQLSNYELREVSTFRVGLKAARTGQGVPLFEDIPGVGVLFRPLPSDESSLQENIILTKATIYPTLFDLMGLRFAPAVADLDTLRQRNEEFVVRSRYQDMENHVYDISTTRVDDALRIPPAERRGDLYRSQETIPSVHPDGYKGPGLNLRDSQLQEGYKPSNLYPPERFYPSDTDALRDHRAAPPVVPGLAPTTGLAPPIYEGADGVLVPSPAGAFPTETIAPDFAYPYADPATGTAPVLEPGGSVIVPDPAFGGHPLDRLPPSNVPVNPPMGATRPPRAGQGQGPGEVPAPGLPPLPSSSVTSETRTHVDPNVGRASATRPAPAPPSAAVPPPRLAPNRTAPPAPPRSQEGRSGGLFSRFRRGQG